MDSHTINSGSKGNRLPTEIEWEYAVSGGQMSKSYTYSGSNEVNEVAWYWTNSGDK
ncbi:SUMF1/EgtB/PvdO family nonheme iron enzyme [Bacillus halotolerans]|uniref:SUMF1/EgtB/PvdO family nonheme iron enzyme n=1 Tax=Bacillus halotolerans TaxID=260554 RepID=UPI002DBC6EF0|nr:SUMF1/EgtB/PvdO family nonheme iron enzyme [Bacillus halotolerans]MEC1546427.1 SUMF1/EgtB/PvdO family nonheme iron enzyme [Bacillus halotolerans]